MLDFLYNLLFNFQLICGEDAGFAYSQMTLQIQHWLRVDNRNLKLGCEGLETVDLILSYHSTMVLARG